MYKYNLLHRLDALNANDREIFWIWAPQALNRSKETIRRWLYIKPESGDEIGFSELIKLAVFFDCKPEDILSSPFDKKALLLNLKSIKDYVYNRI